MSDTNKADGPVNRPIKIGGHSVLFWIIVFISVLFVFQYEMGQDASINALQKVVGLPVPVTVTEEPEMTWQATQLPGAAENNAIIQIEVRTRDGKTTIQKIGTTDPVDAIVSKDWKAVALPTPVWSANSAIIWYDGKNFHCKVQ